MSGLLNFGNDPYSIPEEIAASEDIINEYKEKSIQGSIGSGRFGGLKS